MEQNFYRHVSCWQDFMNNVEGGYDPQLDNGVDSGLSEEQRQGQRHILLWFFEYKHNAQNAVAGGSHEVYHQIYPYSDQPENRLQVQASRWSCPGQLLKTLANRNSLLQQIGAVSELRWGRRESCQAEHEGNSSVQ